MPRPLGHLGRVDAAVEPRGQAGVPEVIWAPRERRGLLGRGQGRLACLGPGAPVGDGWQFAAPDTAEETAIRGSAELVEMLAQKRRQLGMGGHDAAVSLSPVLELSSLPGTPVVRPLAADIGRSAADMQLAPGSDTMTRYQTYARYFCR